MPRAVNTYDYIIVGAGSAGCALAYRLSAESGRRVLLLEAGGRDSLPAIHIPLGFALLMKHAKVNWCYQTEPEPHLNQRRIAWPRGKVLGGCSSINGMVYVRGQREDYDQWAAAGNTGWSYDDVLPYFKRAEHKAEGATEYHGVDGPLWVEEVAAGDKLALADLFVQAGVDSGLPRNHDFNAANQEGAGYYQLNIRKGRRQSSASTYLRQCARRPNLTVETRALGHKIIFEHGRASAVQYTRGSGSRASLHTAFASGEVILCAGVINSPQLLELSGIGNRDLLQPLGIDCVHHLPGVGENLQDHLTINIQQELLGVRTFYEETRPLPLFGNLVKYLTRRRGLLAHPAAQAGMFFCTSEAVNRPDAQIHFAPAAGEEGRGGNIKTVPGSTATVCYLRPESRGSVHIKSADPMVHPGIRANYLACDNDRRAMIAAVRRVREIFRAPTLATHRGRELRPGPQVETDQQILDFVRAEAESVYHPVGTCKMGSDPLAVVDERLRVHSVGGLRVADASIMPSVPSGNTNAATIMIAEKCADMLLEDAAPRG